MTSCCRRCTSSWGSEFSQVLRLYYGAYARKDENIQACALQWLKGEYTTRTQAKADLGVRRIIDDTNVYDSLKLLAAFYAQSGLWRASGLLG